MPAGSLHSISVVGDNTYRKFWCHFTAKVDTLNLFQLIHLPHVLDVPDEAYMEQLFKELIDAYGSALGPPSAKERNIDEACPALS